MKDLGWCQSMELYFVVDIYHMGEGLHRLIACFPIPTVNKQSSLLKQML